jgi:hypothetical protein
MSFGGIGSILGQVGGMALTPALETYLQDAIRKGVAGSDMLKDIADPDTLDTIGNITGGTLGTALGTGLNAGIGYLTGGKEGAASGAVQGLIMGGGAALQHDKFKEAMGMNKGAQAAPVGSEDANRAIMGQVLGGEMSTPKAGTTSTTPTTPTTTTAGGTESETSVGEKKPGYFELTGKLGMPAWTLGMGLGSSMLRNSQFEEEEKKRKYEEALQQQRLSELMSSMYGYAEGGAVSVSTDQGVPTTVTFPDWFVEDFADAGGIGGYAAGGYINTQPMNPDTSYPQSMIPKAQPYPAAAPIRHEVVSMEGGGLLDGEGDGMSDSILANIDGREPVKVADGEYVVPAAVAKNIGADRLQAMMDKVRAASHAKKGKQIVENAGKRAFIQSVSGVKA